MVNLGLPGVLVSQIGLIIRESRQLRELGMAGGVDWFDLVFWEFLGNVQVHWLADQRWRSILGHVLRASSFFQATQCPALCIAETDHCVVGLWYLGVEGIRTSKLHWPIWSHDLHAYANTQVHNVQFLRFLSDCEVIE